jgi:hypothetical protein
MPVVTRFPAAPAPGDATPAEGTPSPAGRAAEYFELLLEDAAAIEYERPLVRARAAGSDVGELAELERVKLLALQVRERNDATVAAIASESAAQRFGLQVLVRDIQPASGDYTRFVELAREATPVPPEVPCKTTVTVILEHRPGTLGQVLTALSHRGVNLAKLESRPIPGEPWRYRFFLDLEGHAASAPLIAALGDLQPLTSSMKVLGTYPRAEQAHG